MTKTAYVCRSCSYHSAKWLGKCPSCDQWNTFEEQSTVRSAKGFRTVSLATPIDQLPTLNEQRLLLPDGELNRVLGGGLMAGSLTLIGGEPGIGKSTLLLQLALSLKKIKVLYVSGEESAQQIKMRADRLSSKRAPSSDLLLLIESRTTDIFEQARRIVPNLVIIDSIQTLESPDNEAGPGSLGQVRTSALACMHFAKETGIPVIITCHITKEGSIAGPKVLEHMVDTVLQFEGDRHYSYRILRTLKNRFGSSSELGIYEMESSGLRQVSNPSELLITLREQELSGISVSVIMEGARALVVECQALVSTSAYGTPQRSALGFDSRRMSMLLAVLEKRCGFRLSSQDVFLNITGGLKIEDPSVDLGLMMAVISSHENITIDQGTCFAAEVGLSGELRAVARIEQRIAEAEKLGFSMLYISSYNKIPSADGGRKIRLVRAKTVEETVDKVFSKAG